MSVLSETPVVAVNAVNDTIIRQVMLPEIPQLPDNASKRLIAQWIALVSDPNMNQPHLLYVSLDMLVLIECKLITYFKQHPLETYCD